jgi:hypothetical protein
MSIKRWIDKGKVVDIYNGVLLNHEEEWNYVICMKTGRTGDHHIKWNKPD